VAFIAESVPFISLIVIIIKNSRKGWWNFTRGAFPARALCPIVKICQPKIYDATGAYLMICLCIASSVRSENARERKDMPDVINATNFPAGILKIFQWL
jgi:hypothetical protein